MHSPHGHFESIHSEIYQQYSRAAAHGSVKKVLSIQLSAPSRYRRAWRAPRDPLIPRQADRGEGKCLERNISVAGCFLFLFR